MGKRITHEEFIEIVESIGNGEYEVLSNYINKKTKVTLRHLKCGHLWDTTPKNFINTGSRCPDCAMTKKIDSLRKTGRKKLTTEEYVRKVRDKYGDNYEVLGSYVDSKTKIKVRHICGHSFYVLPTELYREYEHCPSCRSNKKKTHEQFLKEIEEIVGSEYVVLSQYDGNSKKVKMLHVKCGHEWDVRATLFLHSGTRCPKCNGGIKKIRSHNDYIEAVYKRHGDKYEITSEYINAKTKISFKCDKHGEITTSPQNFLEHGCGKCSYDRRCKTNDEFLSELKNVHGNSIVPLNSYEKYNKKISFQCEKGHMWESRPSNILKGYGCPECSKSTGEKIVNEYLINNNLYYETQYTFENCKNKKLLRFDYFVENKILIEYDGKQHFKPVDFGGKGEEYAEKELKLRRKHDEIKSNYCIENNIYLVRIPYWEEEFEYILDNIFAYFNFLEKDVNDKIIHRYLVNNEDWRYDKYIDQPLII